MSWSDLLYYYTIGNPVSKAVIGSTTSIISRGISKNSAMANTNNAGLKGVPVSVIQGLNRHAGCSYVFIRLAGVSGAAAVLLGAIGSHNIKKDEDNGEAKTVFETANRFHFYHSLALLAIPITKYPFLSGTLMLTSSVCFSGILYYRAFSGHKKYNKYAPYAGVGLIVAWLSLLL